MSTTIDRYAALERPDCPKHSKMCDAVPEKVTYGVKVSAFLPITFLSNLYSGESGTFIAVGE
jgi:hypothetical protein